MIRQAHPTSRRRASGFTITELLVAIAIIIVLIGLTFPVISALQNSGRVEAGLNTVGMASDVARQWVKSSAWADDGVPNPAGERYSGTAALYCPTNEIRIVGNRRNARDAGGNYLEEYLLTTNGYADLQGMDYISIPDGVGIAGIVRTGSAANSVLFIAPPFAIVFDESGHLNFGDTNGLIYYDSDFNGFYDVNDTRPAGYNPKQWDGDGTNDNAALDTGTLSRPLPFEAIPCVAGVIVFSTREYEGQGYSFAGGGAVAINSNEGQWLQENGQTLFFSPHTGVALRDEDDQ